MQNSRNVLVATDAASEASATAKVANLDTSNAFAQHKNTILLLADCRLPLH
jgi:hypothetical protein